jgi:hypothetical protein
VTLEEYEVLSRAVNQLDTLLGRLKVRGDVLSIKELQTALGVLFDAQDILVDESKRRYGDCYSIWELLPGPNVLVFQRDRPIGRL